MIVKKNLQNYVYFTLLNLWIFFCFFGFAKAVAKPKRHDASWVLQNYRFPTQVSEISPRTLPLKWPDAKSDPASALTLGSPPSVIRPPHVIEAALFVPRQLSLIKGSGDAVQLYNMMLTMWRRNEIDTIESFMATGLEKVRKLPRASVERRNFYLLRGHFFFIKWLNLIKNDEKQAEISRLRSMGAYNEAFGFADMGGLFDGQEARIDGRFLRKSLELGYVPSLKMMTQNNKVFHVNSQNYTPEILSDAATPIENIRNNSLAVTWNLAAMLAKDGDWQKAFVAAQAFNGIFERIGARAPYFAGELGNPIMRAFDVPQVSSPIVLLPRKRRDMNAALNLMQAAAYLLDKDGVNALIMADKAIRMAESNSLKAAAMHLAANIYFDLSQHKIAREVYSWAKIIDDDYAERAPGLLFFMAESHFWLGENTQALVGFTEFLNRVGDKAFGPWAKLRVAFIEHRNKSYSTAWTEYEKIYRFHPLHPAALEASVRLFCLSERGVLTKSLKQRLEQVLAEVQNGRLDLQEQAQACSLESRMAIAGEQWKDSRDRTELHLQSKEIQKPMEEFRKEYPDSPYLALFAKTESQINLMKGKAILESSQCDQIIGFFRENGSILFSADAGAARWNDIEKRRLMRCTALASDFSLWAQGIEEKWEPATLDIQKSLLGFEKKPDTRNFNTLKKSLANAGANLDNLAALKEKTDPKILLRLPEFWLALSSYRVAVRDFAAGKGHEKSEKVLESSKLDSCLEKSKSLDSQNSLKIEKVLLTYPEEWWLENFIKASEQVSQCEKLLIDKMFLLARGGKWQILVSKLWYPYLQKRGIRDAAEEWMEYAYFLEKKYGSTAKETVEVFQKISDESTDNLIKETAKLWLEKHARSGQVNW